MKKNIFRSLCISLIMACVIQVQGTVLSVVLNPANPTNLSNGLGYFLAGKTYSFEIQVVEPDVSAWAEITDITLTIPNSTNISISFNPDGTAAPPETSRTGTFYCTYAFAGNLNNFTYTVNITVLWNTEESAWAASRAIQASVTSTVPGANTKTVTQPVSYGVCSSIKIDSMSQTGVASDGYINTWHSAFNVTGNLVYDVPGSGSSDTVHSISDGGNTEITGTTLYYGATAVTTDADESDGLSFAVAAERFNTLAIPLGTNNWTVVATCNTAGGPVTSTNSLALSHNRVEITGIQFANGGGVDAPDYYRSVNIPGCEVRITAQMEYPAPPPPAPLIGNTTVVVRDTTENIDYTVLIPNGSNTGSVVMASYPTTVPAATTEPRNYQVISISGGATDNEQNAAGRITQPASPVIYWDNNDPPGQDTPAAFNGGGFSDTSTASAITLTWDPLSALGDPPYDNDHYSYKIYYREQGAPAWNILDRTSGGIYTDLDDVTHTTTDITGLKSLTTYEYYISALDYFGNEVALANRLYGSLPTQATSIEVGLSDGITSYSDASFTADENATARPLRLSGIKVTITYITTGNTPEQINLIAASDNDTADITADMEDGAGNLTGVEGTDYHRISCNYTGPNTWVGYLPTTLPIMTQNSSVRFIIESVINSVATYSDHDNETEAPPGNPNDYEWTFKITMDPDFTPWPFKVFNNVLTKKSPVAYPAYYLTDDAYVSIKVYDVKGRLVATVLDDSYKRGGRNIKDQGWNGKNKSRRKVGIGLYYMHIRAKRVSDGKLILNKFKKVVMAY